MRRNLTLLWAKSLVEANYHFVSIGDGAVSKGPIIAVSNHTNGMVDAPILIRGSKRPLRFLVKHELLRMPLLGWMVGGTGAVPVYRRKDKVPTSWNDGVFDEIHRSLAAGDAIGVFPEGTSHLEAGIRPLRTGAARIALGAEESAGWKLGVRIVPVGIHYCDRAAMGSRVLAVVGQAVDLASFEAQHKDAPWDTALELTGKIHEALEGVRIELLEADAAPLIGVVLDEIQAGTTAPAEATQALHSLVDGWRALLERDESAARSQLARLRELDRVRRSDGLAAWLGRGLQVVAACLWIVPVLIARLFQRVVPLPLDKRATIMLLASSILFPAWLVIVPWVAGAQLGCLWGGLGFVLLCLSAWGAWVASRTKYTRALPSEVAEERARIAEEIRGTKNQPSP